MQSKYDEELFEWHLTSELMRVDVATDTVAPLAPPRMYADVTPSPDDTLMIVSWIERPFSYGVALLVSNKTGFMCKQWYLLLVHACMPCLTATPFPAQCNTTAAACMQSFQWDDFPASGKYGTGRGI